MLEDLLDHIRVLDDRYHPHFRKIPGAYERIDLVNFLYQPRPVFAKRLVGQFRLQDAGNLIVGVSLFSLAARDPDASGLQYP